MTICCQKLAIVTARAAFMLVALSSITTKGDHDDIANYPGLAEPQILYVADGDWAQGSWRSLAITQDSKSLIGSLVRNPGSRTQFLLGHRIGEVRSFDLKATEKDSKILVTGRDVQFQILKAASGASREPLLLTRWSIRKLKEIDLLKVTPNEMKDSFVRKFEVPRAEKVTTSAMVSFSLMPTPEILILGLGFMEWKDGARSATWWGDVKAWDLQTGDTRFADAWNGDQVLAVACAADGKLVAAAGGHAESTVFSGEHYEGRVVCWDQNFTKKRFDLRLPKHQVHCMAFSPDSKTLVTGGIDGTMKWIDVVQGTVIKSLNIASLSGKTLGRIESLAFYPNGNLSAAGVGSWNRGNTWGETFLIDTATAKVYKVPSSQEDHVIRCVAFSPDGKYLATGSMLGVLKLWELPDRK